MLEESEVSISVQVPKVVKALLKYSRHLQGVRTLNYNIEIEALDN